MATLYRKYRPQNFDEVVGQNHIKLTLEHEISTGKIAHAYLFCGPRAVGKTTISRVFSKAVNCLNRTEGQFEPCNKCDSCNEINTGRNLDIIEIDAASHTGVDNVRENIISVSRLAPSRYKYKVFIIDEVHMLSVSAFNALLKTLEEPPTSAIFILCTTEVHKIPATIISRCQRFDFKRIGVNEIVKRLQSIAQLEDIKVDREVLEAIARHSEGHMRDAESLFGQVLAIGGKEISREEADLVIPRNDLREAVNLIGLLVKKDAGSAIGLVNRLITDGVDIKRFSNDTIELLRKVMLGKVSPILAEKLGMELGESLDLEINQIIKDGELSSIVRIIERIMRAKSEVKNSFIPQLPLEIAITELCADLTPTSTSVSAYSNKINNISTPKVSVRQSQVPSEARNITPTQNQSINSTILEKTETSAPVEHKFVEVVAGEALITREMLREKWGEILIRVKKYNHSLPFILQVCDPREINGNQVCLAFKYKFHKERLSDVKMKEVMEKVFYEVFNLPLTLEAIVDDMIDAASTAPVNETVPSEQDNSENLNPTPIANETEDNENSGRVMIDDLLKTFGGKVVG